jgi:hypothetical protein
MTTIGSPHLQIFCDGPELSDYSFDTAKMFYRDATEAGLQR